MNEALRGEIEAYLAAEDVELYDLSLKGGGKARLLRVTVDADGGLGVDRIADLSRGLSRLLDDGDAINGPYTLEVTSPGLERTLSLPGHYRRAVGREVAITTSVPVDGETAHRGTLEAVSDDGVTVLVGEHSRTISFEAVSRAQTVFRWEAQAKPGHK